MVVVSGGADVAVVHGWQQEEAVTGTECEECCGGLC